MKIVILGNNDDQKLKFEELFLNNSNSFKYLSSLGVDIIQKEFLPHSIVSFWVITGNPAYFKLINSYIEGSAGVIILANQKEEISRWESLSNLVCPKAKIFVVALNSTEKPADHTPHSNCMENQFGHNFIFVSQEEFQNHKTFTDRVLNKILV